jgi:hypothetical protein
MEQHYIVTFGISGESAHQFYTLGIIIKKYPGDPTVLLVQILDEIEKNSYKHFNRYIFAKNIGIRSLTLVNTTV